MAQEFSVTPLQNRFVWIFLVLFFEQPVFHQVFEFHVAQIVFQMLFETTTILLADIFLQSIIITGLFIRIVLFSLLYR